MRWINFFHVYQPPHWPRRVITKVARESYRPLVQFLLKHRNIHITLNVAGSLTEQLRMNGYRDIIAGIRTLLERGQVELTDSSMYHAILPLLTDHEIKRQIFLNRQVNRRAFGRAYEPRGFFPPEMAYNQKLGRLLDRLGYTWVILDGISHPGVVDYLVHNRVRSTELSVVFRNRYMSDYLAFAAQLNETRKFLATTKRWNSQTDVLVTAMDGENLGHHRHEARSIWQTLVQLPYVRALTISEVLPSLVPDVKLTPRAASWSSRKHELDHGTPFKLWKDPDNQLHRLQWRLFKIVHRLVEECAQSGRLPSSIRKAFDQAVASDWYWWASREPWWDVDIVLTSAHRLQTIAFELCPKQRDCEIIQTLTRSIAELAHAWHSSGDAQRHAARFLRNERTPRYLGGERVRYT